MLTMRGIVEICIAAARDLDAVMRRKAVVPVYPDFDGLDAEKTRTTERQDDPDEGASCEKIAAERQGCAVQLLPSPDPLTRLLMEADGVAESDIHALLKQIVTEREAGV
jgi:hypothetical protein